MSAMSHVSFHDERPGLYCIEIRTDHWDASVDWYRNILGLRVLVRVTDDGYALLDAGETRLALLKRTAPGEPTRRISLAFEVPDIRAIINRLTKQGLSYSPPKTDAEGLREVNVTDPDGNRLRLFAWPRGR
jgi:catechol 2,3-dioxygenase-like lactoylglutathione lyase family enzyme